MDEQILFDLLRADLNRLGERPDDEYLKTLLRAACIDLERRGVHFPDDANGVDVEDYQTLIVGTARGCTPSAGQARQCLNICAA